MDWKTAIRIDRDMDPAFGHDEAYVSYPTVFPTVSFQLEPTDDLVNAVTEGENYEFYIGINGYTPSHLDTVLTAYVDDDLCSIDLTDEDQAEIFNVLDAQCSELFGKGCDELLEEAKSKMSD